jgi:hypothetical protein
MSQSELFPNVPCPRCYAPAGKPCFDMRHGWGRLDGQGDRQAEGRVEAWLRAHKEHAAPGAARVVSATDTTTVLVYADTPPSLNRMGTRGSHWTTTSAKTQWQQDIGMLLLAHRVPRNLHHVTASAVLRFPVRRGRDEDNHAWLLAKALGDALVNGWLPDDTPEHFHFTGLTFDPEPGPRRTTITLRLR